MAVTTAMRAAGATTATTAGDRRSAHAGHPATSKPSQPWYIAGVAGKFLDDPVRAAFAAAIEAIEGASAVEVVIAVRRRSASYLYINVGIGLGVAFAALATMLFAEHVFALPSILIDPFVVGGLAGAAVELLPQVKRALVWPGPRGRSVRHAARAMFVERGVHNTRDRSGMLLYISWLERRAVLVLDTGIARALSGDEVRRAEDALTRAIGRGGAAVAHELAQLAPVLRQAMPHRADDINELPDAIDSDLERGRRGRR